jgi:predicted nucleic acid-binding Zn ribbon protein
MNTVAGFAKIEYKNFNFLLLVTGYPLLVTNILMPFEAIGKKLGKAIKKAGIQGEVEAALVCRKFDEIVKARWGEAMQDKVQAQHVKKKVLTVASLHSVMAQEIKLHEEELIEELNSHFETTPVKSLRFIT